MRNGRHRICGNLRCSVRLRSKKNSTASGGRISYGIVMTVTENGFNETTSFPDISFSRKKLRDFVSMLERNDVSPAHVEEMIDDFFYAG